MKAFQMVAHSDEHWVDSKAVHWAPRMDLDSAEHSVEWTGSRKAGCWVEQLVESSVAPTAEN